MRKFHSTAEHALMNTGNAHVHSRMNDLSDVCFPDTQKHTSIDPVRSHITASCVLCAGRAQLGVLTPTFAVPNVNVFQQFTDIFSKYYILLLYFICLLH